jgi:hypothetical protein
MYQLKRYFVIVSILLEACSSQNDTNTNETLPWEMHLSAERNIAKNAIVLENNEDFSFLDKIDRDRLVIILGEEGHEDYLTSEIKIKMIDYLQNKGFNSIALEGATFLASYVFSNPEYAELTESWRIEKIWFLEQTNHKIYQPFIEAIQERKIKSGA